MASKDSAASNAIVNDALTRLEGNEKLKNYAWKCKICDQRIENRLKSKCTHLRTHKRDPRLPHNIKEYLKLIPPNVVLELESGTKSNATHVSNSAQSPFPDEFLKELEGKNMTIFERDNLQSYRVSKEQVISGRPLGSNVWHLAWNLECIERLLKADEKNYELLNTPDSNGISPLLFHISQRNREVIKRILDMDSVDLTWNSSRISPWTLEWCPDPWKFGNALHAFIAKFENMEKDIDILIKIHVLQGKLVTARSNDGGKSILHLRLQAGGFSKSQVPLLDWLLEHVKNQADDDRKVALHYASDSETFAHIGTKDPIQLATRDLQGHLPDITLVRDSVSLTKLRKAYEDWSREHSQRITGSETLSTDNWQ
jgi:hypothetical protein